MYRIFAILAVVLGLAACQPTTTGVQTQVSRSGQVWVGAFLPEQSPRVDSVSAGRHENDYFMPLWREYQAGRVNGARADITLYLLTNGREEVIFRGLIDGYRYVAINRGQVGQQTQLCVLAPFDFTAAHQTRGPAPNIMCTVQGDMNAYFVQGRGRTESDAWGVVAIASAGS